MTIFEKIIAGDIPAVKVCENDFCMVIMDKFPIAKGQTLVISKKAIDKITDLDEETYTHMFLAAKNIATASDAALGSKRCFLLVEGLEVPHAHIKIYPLFDEKIHLNDGSGDMVEDAELEVLAQKIKDKM